MSLRIGVVDVARATLGLAKSRCCCLFLSLAVSQYYDRYGDSLQLLVDWVPQSLWPATFSAASDLRSSDAEVLGVWSLASASCASLDQDPEAGLRRSEPSKAAPCIWSCLAAAASAKETECQTWLTRHLFGFPLSSMMVCLCIVT